MLSLPRKIVASLPTYVALMALGKGEITLNINGLFGQYLPKRVDLSLASQEELNTIAFEFNARPQNHGSAPAFQCAIEVMYELMARLNATSPSIQ